jgi:hypothetical protein
VSKRFGWDEIVGAGGDQYVAIRLRDVGGLVKQQGGATGSLAFQIAPQTISSKVYDEMAKQIADSMAQKGVQADVSVQSAPGIQAQRGELFRGVLLGVAGVGVGYAAWKYVLRGLIKGRR